VDIEVCFGYDLHIEEVPVPVAEKVEGEYNGAVGGIFKRDDAIGGGARLGSAEDVWPGGSASKSKIGWWGDAGI